MYNTSCGGNLNPGNEPIMFHSPEFPSAYPPLLKCEWVIAPLGGESVQLTIGDVDVEPFCDSVEVCDVIKLNV